MTKIPVESLLYNESISLMNGERMSSDDAFALRWTKICPYCGERIELTHYEEYTYIWEDFARGIEECTGCRWWRRFNTPDKSYSIGSTAHMGILHKSNLIENRRLSCAITQILQNTGRLRTYDSHSFERLVGEVMSEFLACKVEHTGKSNDGGIDLLILDSNKGPIPIQVKRRQIDGKVESVSLVREFRGAMLLAGHNRGIIVSTADHFSSEAVKASSPASQHLSPQTIDLIDCRRFLDILRVIKLSAR